MNRGPLVFLLAVCRVSLDKLMRVVLLQVGEGGRGEEVNWTATWTNGPRQRSKISGDQVVSLRITADDGGGQMDVRLLSHKLHF